MKAFISAAVWLTVSLVSSASLAQDVRATRLSVVPQSRTRGRTLSVLDEDLVLRCHAESQRLTCSSESRLVVVNPAATPVELTLEVDKTADRLAVNESAVGLSAPEGQLVLNGQATLSPGSSRLAVNTPRAYQIDASAKSSEFVTSVVVTRHPTLGQVPGRPLGAELPLQSVAFARRWKEVRRTHITLIFPSDWELTPALPQCADAPVPESGCQRTLTETSVAAEWLQASNTQETEPLARLVTLAPHSGTLSNGGLLVGGAWGGTGKTESGGCLGCTDALRVRAGYELGLNSWGILGIVGEFSPHHRVVVVPSLDYAAFPNLGSYVPAITFGMGLPLVVSPRAGGGMRWQMSATWPVGSTCSVGLATMFDLLIVSERTERLGSIALQFGL